MFNKSIACGRSLTSDAVSPKAAKSMLATAASLASPHGLAAILQR
jgi:hypothetical protein